MKVSDFLHNTAQNFPAHVAVHDEYGSLTYSELDAAVQSVAATLIKNNIGRGMGIGVMGRNSRNFIIMAFAVIETGAVVMPISHQISQSELDEILLVSSLHAIISDNSNQQNKIVDGIHISLSNETWTINFNAKVDRAFIFASHVTDAALVRFTSGTTGSSKGVILSHRVIEERTAAANQVLQLNENDKVMWVLSMAYHFVVSIMLYIRYGCAIIINRDFMAATLLDEINRYHATFLYASPMHIRLLSRDKSDKTISSIKRVISTSTAVSKEQCVAFQNRYEVPVSQAYGIIEIGLPIINFENAIDAPAAIGFAVPGFNVEILDDNGNALPPNKIGHLAIRGPGMFDAYLNPPLMRDEVLNNGWFMTGDLASKNVAGLITVEGRKKSMINVAGNKVFPEEVEAVLIQFPGIKLSRVSAYMHKLLGECVQAEVVLNTDLKNLDEENLRSFCRKHLSSYKVPQKIIVVDELAMTGSGKVKR